MSIPNYQEFMLPVLKQLSDGKEHLLKSVASNICVEFEFTEEEMNLRISSGNGRVIYGRIGWAKTYLVQAGLISQPKRGVCLITDRGREALESGAEINNNYLSQFSEYQSFKRRSNKKESTSERKNTLTSEEAISEETPIEKIESTISSLESALSKELLDSILNATPVFLRI
ncbi:mrr restriction system protein [Vibrio sp. JCM 19236]|nr:mrr restriction system protein [Vibrio sp. JCM 19236]